MILTSSVCVQTWNPWSMIILCSTYNESKCPPSLSALASRCSSSSCRGVIRIWDCGLAICLSILLLLYLTKVYSRNQPSWRSWATANNIWSIAGTSQQPEVNDNRNLLHEEKLSCVTVNVRNKIAILAINPKKTWSINSRASGCMQYATHVDIAFSQNWKQI